MPSLLKLIKPGGIYINALTPSAILERNASTIDLKYGSDRMSDIVFILPNEDLEGINEATQTPSLGVAYLAATLMKHRFSCKVIDKGILKVRDSEVIEVIKKEAPWIVGISANLFTGNAGIRISQKIKKTFGEKISVIFGGAFPTSRPDKFLTEGSADAVVLGEGENALLEIMRNFKEKESHLFKDIAGLAYAENGQINITRQRSFEKNLDSLPFPAWNIFPDLKFYKTRSRKSPVAPILTSRGCPFNCIYCSKDVFRSTFRQRSAENVIQEVDFLVKNFGIKQLDIMDDNFSFDRDRAERILDLIIKGNYNLTINLQLGVRVDSVDEDLLKKMKMAGVYKIAFGVESGDQRILKNIRKQLDLECVLKNTLLARKQGMIVYGFFMFGLPGDNAESMLKTIRFAIKMNPSIANFVITIPFPGTELFDLVKANGRFLVDTSVGLKTGFYANRVFYELADLKEHEVLYYYRLAYRLFYFRLSKILEILFSIRAFSEFKWVLNTGLPLFFSLIRRNTCKKD